jgi:8-oxo-dGTP pyrophosphatase MutT (NUDIX family)
MHMFNLATTNSWFLSGKMGPFVLEVRLNNMTREKPAPVVEISAGGFVVSKTDSTLVALMARFNRGGKLEWCIPKGHLEPNETNEQAALREVFEETGLSAEITDYLGDVSYTFNQKGKNVSKTVHVYLMNQVSGELTMEHDPNHEASELAWVKLSELINRLSHVNEKRIAQVALELIEARS